MENKKYTILGLVLLMGLSAQSLAAAKPAVKPKSKTVAERVGISKQTKELWNSGQKVEAVKNYFGFGEKKRPGETRETGFETAVKPRDTDAFVDRPVTDMLIDRPVDIAPDASMFDGPGFGQEPRPADYVAPTETFQPEGVIAREPSNRVLGIERAPSVREVAAPVVVRDAEASVIPSGLERAPSTRVVRQGSSKGLASVQPVQKGKFSPNARDKILEMGGAEVKKARSLKAADIRLDQANKELAKINDMRSPEITQASSLSDLQASYATAIRKQQTLDKMQAAASELGLMRTDGSIRFGDGREILIDLVRETNQTKVADIEARIAKKNADQIEKLLEQPIPASKEGALAYQQQLVDKALEIGVGNQDQKTSLAVDNRLAQISKLLRSLPASPKVVESVPVEVRDVEVSGLERAPSTRVVRQASSTGLGRSGEVAHQPSVLPTGRPKMPGLGDLAAARPLRKPVIKEVAVETRPAEVVPPIATGDSRDPATLSIKERAALVKLAGAPAQTTKKSIVAKGSVKPAKKWATVDTALPTSATAPVERVVNEVVVADEGTSLSFAEKMAKLRLQSPSGAKASGSVKPKGPVTKAKKWAVVDTTPGAETASAPSPHVSAGGTTRERVTDTAGLRAIEGIDASLVAAIEARFEREGFTEKDKESAFAAMHKMQRLGVPATQAVDQILKWEKPAEQTVDTAIEAPASVTRRVEAETPALDPRLADFTDKKGRMPLPVLKMQMKNAGIEQSVIDAFLADTGASAPAPAARPNPFALGEVKLKKVQRDE